MDEQVMFNGTVEEIENTSRKVASIDDGVTDVQYPSAKAVKQYVSDFTENNDIVADYVISQGKDETTSLYYRKWKSGTAECWGTVDYKGMVNEKIGNRYMGGLISKAFPSGLFNSTPQILVSPKLGQINFSVVRAQWSYASASNSGNYRVISDNELSSTPTETFVISIYVVGTWK